MSCKLLGRLKEANDVWSYFFFIFEMIITSSVILIVARVFQGNDCKMYDLLMQLAAMGIIVGYFGGLVGFVLFFLYYWKKLHFFP